jgi:acylglycerol lipase
MKMPGSQRSTPDAARGPDIGHSAPRAGGAPEFPPGRLPGGIAPRWLELVLPDGYRTAVCLVPAEKRNADAPAPASGSGAAEKTLPILYFHGIQSHPGWFIGSAAHLAATGRPVYLVTRRGSGRNQADRGHANSARQLLDDVEAACLFVLADSAAARLHVAGVSWGGKLLAAYLARGGNGNGGGHGKKLPAGAIASIALIAPGIVPRVDVPWWKKAAIGACAIFRPRRLFDIPLADPSLFTDSDAMRDYIRRDTMSLRRATARFLFAGRMLDEIIRHAPRGAIQTPTTLILASRDRIIDSEATRRELQRLTAGRCEVRELPGAHTLEFEPQPAALHETLETWISRIYVAQACAT